MEMQNESGATCKNESTAPHSTHCRHKEGQEEAASVCFKRRREGRVRVRVTQLYPPARAVSYSKKKGSFKKRRRPD
jgi:hypothetical protein